MAQAIISSKNFVSNMKVKFSVNWDKECQVCNMKGNCPLNCPVAYQEVLKKIKKN